MNWEFSNVQAGLWRGRGIRDQIANVHQIMEKAREFQKNIHLCFIYYAKAFDSVDYDKLQKLLQEMGVSDHLTSLLRNLQVGQEATVRIRHWTTDWLNIVNGLRPTIYCHPAYLMSIQSQFSSVTQSCPPLCDHASLSITNSPSLLKLMSFESTMPSNHLILCRTFLLPPSIFPSIRVFSNESVLHIGWSKYWRFSLRASPSNEYSGLISFRMDWLDLHAVQGSLKSLLQHHSSKASSLRCSAFFIVQLRSTHDYGKKHSFD